MVEATTKRQNKGVDLLGGLTNLNYTPEIVNAKDVDPVTGLTISG